MVDSLIRRANFKAVRIFTNGGRHYDTTHPDNFAFGKSEFFYYFPKSDRSVHVPYRNIAAVEELGAARPKK